MNGAQGDYERATVLYGEAVAALWDLGDKVLIADGLNLLHSGPGAAFDVFLVLAILPLVAPELSAALPGGTPSAGPPAARQFEPHVS